MTKYINRHKKQLLHFVRDYSPEITYIKNNIDNNLFINSFNIYVINVKTNIIRKKYITQLFERMNINYTLITVEKINTPLTIHLQISLSEFGCLLSHLWCLNNIITNKSEKNIIFEDDVIFHKNFNELFYNTFHNKIEYDLVLLGACDFHFSKYNYKNVNNGLYPLTDSTNSKHTYGAHANFYSLKGAQTIFNTHLNRYNETYFDNNYYTVFSKLPNTSFICYPNLVVCELSTSNLNHLYPFFSEEETNYYNRCFNDFQFTNYHFIYLCLLECSRDTYEDNIHYFFNGDISKINKMKERFSIDYCNLFISNGDK
jgi:hypothetical protein